MAAASAFQEAAAVPPTPVERAETERTVAALRHNLDEATFARCWTEGRALAFEQAIDYALESY